MSLADLWTSSAGRALPRLLGNRRLRTTLANAYARRVPAAARGRLDPHLAAMLALNALVDESRVAGKTPERARRSIRDGVRIVASPPLPSVQISSQELLIDRGSLPVRVYVPQRAADPSPGVLFLHGGGWVVGSTVTHDSVCTQIAEGTGARVVSADYRLAPEHRFPCAVQDVLAAFRAMVTAAARLRIDPQRIAVSGDSAGGNLSAVVSLRTRGDAVRPACAVLLYPALDATFSMPSHRELGHGLLLEQADILWYYGHYAGPDALESVRRDPDVSPFHAPDVGGCPPTAIISAELDPLRDEARAYGDRLREAGVPVRYVEEPGMTHGFSLLTRASPAAASATHRYVATLREMLLA